MNSITMTCWPSIKAPIGKRVQTTWQRFCERMRKPIATRDKLSLPGFALASFKGHRRAKANVEAVYALGFDFDALDESFGELCPAFRNAAFVHTTWSHTSDAPRARAFMLLARPVNASEYERLWGHCASVIALAGHVVDEAAKDASRLWFPSAATPGSGERSFRCEHIDGAPLDVDTILAGLPVQAATDAAPRRRRSVAPTATTFDVVTRARKYLERCEPAVSGSGGHNTAFLVAQKLVRGFGLDEATAFALLSSDWNSRCQPPWSQHELIRKIRQAAEAGQMPEGSLRDAPRRTG